MRRRKRSVQLSDDKIRKYLAAYGDDLKSITQSMIDAQRTEFEARLRRPKGEKQPILIYGPGE